MTIKITRKTGLMGATVPVKLIVDGEESINLGSGKSHTFKADKMEVKATQFGFQSQKEKIEESGEFFIKINANMMILFIIMIICVCIGAILNVYILSIIGFIGGIGALIYGRNNWFQIVKSDE
ncbi:hypothetical protein [Listeria welshimeri]|uniref:Uncharacterized protein n=1 Tax=Listeria welshimeri serovar 6b (strain ATCC 35897 / DSM 20650 / CCUG 15529 / CIP 8149 / NCTC 11857 / SLCC 5334 / V8) TaxID=386043 RepID=A0AES8_LISW6|nr:hypothetical protein [Listeria welshimeri]MBC1455331.1 hypothetical protein [Listeria welshimeri]MBC1633778.1 hypothetical protein [Listeria welshimeri]MBC1681204.1 hypothetical protein [Listeria welshimeri]MBC1705482.1 hypothetical protein [Listeria welshimeri]MBC1715941.1 hypothetical protein [Listeria welshimeri]